LGHLQFLAIVRKSESVRLQYTAYLSPWAKAVAIMSNIPEFSVRDGRPGRPRNPKIGVHLVLCLVIAAGTATIFVLYQEYRNQRLSLAVSPPDEAPKDPAPQHTGISRPRGGIVRPVVVENTQPSGSPAPGTDAKLPGDSSPEAPEPSPEPVDPAKQEAFTRAVADSRKAMSEHNLSRARSHLNRARPDVQTDDDRALIERVDTMLDHLGEFWVGARKAIANLKSGDEFTVKDTVVVIVEVGENEVVVRAVGENRRYPLDDLPHRLLLALAEKWFADVPSSKVLIGAYLAVDPKGDPARARQLWQDASRQGVDVDPLMPELKYWESVPRVAKSVDELRDNPPDEEVLKDTRRKVVEQFKEDYERANSLPRKAALAKKLLATADKDGDPVTYLATIHEARELAIAAGAVSIVCEAIDVLAEYGKLDPLTEKATSLEKAGKNVRGLAANRELVHRALKLLEEAIVYERASEAKQLADLAANAAQQSKNASLIRQAASAGKRVSELDK
jgi:hypothetical protein